jgi:hypothetical protein
MTSETRSRKPHRDDHAEREHSSANQRDKAGRVLDGWRPPDAIEIALQLSEHGSRAKQERHGSDCRRHGAGAGFAGACQELFGRSGALIAQKAAELRNDFAARGIGSERQSGDGNDQDQNGSQRERGVVRQRRAHARCVVVVPGLERLLRERPELTRREHLPRSHRRQQTATVPSDLSAPPATKQNPEHQHNQQQPTKAAAHSRATVVVAAPASREQEEDQHEEDQIHKSLFLAGANPCPGSAKGSTARANDHSAGAGRVERALRPGFLESARAAA